MSKEKKRTFKEWFEILAVVSILGGAWIYLEDLHNTFIVAIDEERKRDAGWLADENEDFTELHSEHKAILQEISATKSLMATTYSNLYKEIGIVQGSLDSKQLKNIEDRLDRIESRYGRHPAD